MWTPTFPPLPQVVTLPRGPVRLEDFDAPGDMETGRRMGDYDESTRLIRVARDAEPHYRALVFYHEVVHVALQDSGLHNLLKPKMQEAICDAVATALLRMLHDDRQDPDSSDAPEAQGAPGADADATGA